MKLYSRANSIKSYSWSRNQVLVSLTTILTSSIVFVILVSCKSENDGETINPTGNRLLIVTAVIDSNHEGFQRFNRSIEAFNLDLIVLGTNRRELNGIEPENGEAQKIDLYRKALKTYKNEKDLIIMVVNSNNLIVNGNQRDILRRFGKFSPGARVVFSADSICWPDPSLASRYLSPLGGGDRYLSAEAFIGYAPAIWELLNVPIATNLKENLKSSSQLYFTYAYLDSEIRTRIAIDLDHRAELFQNLQIPESDVELEFNSDNVYLKNLAYLTQPLVLHARGASRVVLNSLGNYIGKAWTIKDGCRYCNQSMISLSSLKEFKLPTVLIGLFIEEPTPFMESFFSSVRKLNYPRDKIHLFIHNGVEFHDKQVNEFLDQYGSQYASQQVEKRYESGMLEWEARNEALQKCKQLDCDHYLSLDSVARLDLADSLRILIETNKTIVAPLLSRPKKLWSNFWGSLTADGYYSRSHDYVDLVRRDRVGLWNVPHIMNAYLLNGKFVTKCLENSSSQRVSNNNSATTKTDLLLPNLTYHDTSLSLKPILTFTYHLRSSNTFQYMINTHEFGHLVDPTSYNISLTNPDFYQLSSNMIEWEEQYLHQNYSRNLEENTKLEQPCQDVYWFPLVNELFCNQMIEIMEAFGQWSGGTNDDPRIEGGYESVPTRDIHMKQVGLHELWLTFLSEFVMPVQLKEFIGYEHDPPRAELAFVVRYHPAEQASLRPHHDSSTYTLNIALNSPKIDYEGGGCRFVRYNCSVIESRKGWALIHPGRLTHYHEGLPVTKGARYIMVTFVDP